MGVRVITGDVRRALASLADESVHCVVTSPPYWGLRDYGTASWSGGDADCAHRVGGQVQDSKWEGAITTGQRPGADSSTCRSCGAARIDAQIGLEPTPEQYVETMVGVFREVRRVLRRDGTLWLNLGDSYAGSGKGAWDRTDIQKEVYVPKPGGREASMPKVPLGLKPKDLVGIPWRVAFALQSDGWYLRSDIIWAKPNPMPESVTDRPTRSHEYLFLLTRSPRYYYDAEAIKEPLAASSVSRLSQPTLDQQAGSTRANGGAKTNGPMKAVGERPTDKQRAIAQAATEASRRRYDGFNDRWDASEDNGSAPAMRNKRDVWTISTKPFKGAHFATFPPQLVEPCVLAGSPAGGTVLDPFAGSGTTGAVAKQHGRDAVLIELNREYVPLIRKRVGAVVDPRTVPTEAPPTPPTPPTEAVDSAPDPATIVKV